MLSKVDESSSGTSVTATDGSDHGSRSDEETPSPNEKVSYDPSLASFAGGLDLKLKDQPDHFKL